MANWIGAFRSNYFRVKDEKEFDKLLAFVQAEDFQHWTQYDPADNSKILHAIGGYDSVPTWLYDNETDEEIPDKDFLIELGQHLADDEVAIIMEAGYEKLRYCSGSAIAVSRDDTGETKLLSVNLEDIYKMVKDEWELKPTEAQY
jgi:hypothetical protein